MAWLENQMLFHQFTFNCCLGAIDDPDHVIDHHVTDGYPLAGLNNLEELKKKKNSVCLFVWRSVYLQIGRDERRWSDWWCGSRDVTRRPLSNFDWLHPMSFISGRTTFSQTSQINLDVVDVTGVIFPRRTNKYDPIRFTIRLWIGKIPHCSLYVELIRFHWQLKVIVKHSEQSSEFASW